MKKGKDKYKKDKAYQLEMKRRYNLGLAMETSSFIFNSMMRKKSGLDYFIKKLDMAKQLLEQMKEGAE